MLIMLHADDRDSIGPIRARATIFPGQARAVRPEFKTKQRSLYMKSGAFDGNRKTRLTLRAGASAYRNQLSGGGGWKADAKCWLARRPRLKPLVASTQPLPPP